MFIGSPMEVALANKPDQNGIKQPDTTMSIIPKDIQIYIPCESIYPTHFLKFSPHL